MNSAFTWKLGLYIQKTNVRAQKIDGSTLKTFGIVIAYFQVEDKIGRPKFFQKTFLVTNTKLEVVLEMLFLKINNTDMAFGEKTLTQKSYTTNKTLSTTKRVQLVDLKKFVIVALYTDSKTFVVHMAIWEWEEMVIDSAKKAQIKAQNGAQSKAQVRALIFNEALTKVPVEYSDYSNVFSIENAAELLKHIRLNDHTIVLEKSKQPPFRHIYSLGLVELKTLTSYIKTNLANSFIWPSKSLAGAPIFFN